MTTARLQNSIFLHVPKTGGSWISSVLDFMGSVVEPAAGGLHFGPKEIGNLDRLKHWRKLPMFCFVRHPVTWYQTYWAFRTKSGWDDQNSFDVECRDENFGQFVMNAIRFRPGYVTRMYESFTAGVQAVGRTETLREDLIRILSDFGERFDTKAIYETRSGPSARRELLKECRYDAPLLACVVKSELAAIKKFGYDLAL